MFTFCTIRRLWKAPGAVILNVTEMIMVFTGAGRPLPESEPINPDNSKARILIAGDIRLNGAVSFLLDLQQRGERYATDAPKT
jgi:hypothetical protein